jgi:hypothetical protein
VIWFVPLVFMAIAAWLVLKLALDIARLVFAPLRVLRR